MHEVFPVLAGIGLGLATSAVRANWLKSLLIAVLGLAIGATASRVSGELAISWVYVLIDTAQVVGASVLTGILVTVWVRRRRARAIAR
ncbi:MAG: hypothetical protein DME07_03905 [Candidatus Rokuibacteriota bacterium]|nr:MAG: hypothetical protein DME07_03905 [Candidatus Rokubacteria bacterium]PYN55546.1 MAG: hypothetical protein DMD94_11080 [Candidatus Rokubacteria bacterium]